MRRAVRILKKRSGTTLTEMIVTMLLISIMLAMATASLSSASKIFVRIQKTEYAQSIVDTVMTELRTITKNATSYVKIYGDGTEIAGITGNLSGKALEFINEDGYVILVTTDGCEVTNLYTTDTSQFTGTADAVESGQLLTRYYTQNATTQRYQYSTGSAPMARAVATAYGKGFYMGNYVEVTYTFPDGSKEGSKVSNVKATVRLYSDATKADLIAEDSESLDFRYNVTCKMAKTAVSDASDVETTE